MADIVESVLKAAEERESKFKTTDVKKDIDLLFDEGNLLATDQNPLDIKQYRSKKEEFLLNLARDNTQLLINAIWKLPAERVEDAVVCKLPATKTILPREKPIPKAKAETKWQQFAKMKGIQNKKKSRMVYDEKSKNYKPLWGYKRANDETKEWVLEVPQNADPYEDQFEKRTKAKQERVAKNELQRLRNIARSQKSKVPGVGLTPVENPSKDRISKALVVAKKSTASIGKFTEKLPKEKPTKHTGKKRKFEPNAENLSNEKTKQLEIFKNINNKKPKLDINRAVNLHENEEQEKRRRQKGGKTDKKSSKSGAKGRSKGKGKGKGRRK